MSVLSKSITHDHQCKNFFHPYNNSCFDTHSEIFVSAITNNVKYYTILYVASLLLIKRRIPTWKMTIETIRNIIRSAYFMSVNGLMGIGGICVYRNLFGTNFGYYTSVFLPVFIGSCASIIIELPQRRKFLALYLANFASEALFNAGIHAKLFHPIKNGLLYLCMFSSAAILYIYKSIKSKDAIISVMRQIIGPNEEYGYNSNTSVTLKTKPLRKAKQSTLAQKVNHVVENVLEKYPRHSACSHKNSCVHYVLKGISQAFIKGFAVKVIGTLLLNVTRWIKNPKILGKLFLNKHLFTLGACTGAYAGIARLTMCILRWMRNKDSNIHGIIAGLLAGISFYPYTTNKNITLNLLWKSLELLYDFGIKNNVLSSIPGAPILLYSASLGILYHYIIYNPDMVRPSYVKLIGQATGGRSYDMSRSMQNTVGKNGASFFT